MSELLKDTFNKKSIREFATVIQKVYTPFNADEFLSSVSERSDESKA